MYIDKSKVTNNNERNANKKKSLKVNRFSMKVYPFEPLIMRCFDGTLLFDFDRARHVAITHLSGIYQGTDPIPVFHWEWNFGTLWNTQLEQANMQGELWDF